MTDLELVVKNFKKIFENFETITKDFDSDEMYDLAVVTAHHINDNLKHATRLSQDAAKSYEIATKQFELLARILGFDLENHT